MDTDRLNRWLTLLANIGVIAGIGFLALEVRQNNQQLETQIAINQHQIRVNDIGRVVDDESIAIAHQKMLAGKALSDVERHRLYWMFATRFVNWELLYSLDRLELHGVTTSFERSPMAEAFWQEYRDYLRPNFVGYIEDNVPTLKD